MVWSGDSDGLPGGQKGALGKDELDSAPELPPGQIDRLRATVEESDELLGLAISRQADGSPSPRLGREGTREGPNPAAATGHESVGRYSNSMTMPPEGFGAAMSGSP